jgi:phosphate transport system ATP-binding protein
MMAENKMAVEHLDLYYDDFHALKDVSLGMEENRVTALIGPSGCGKSTLLRCLNRMNDRVGGCRHTGSVLLDGEDVHEAYDVCDLRLRVGMVFQRPNPFPLSIYDNVAYGPRRHLRLSRGETDELVGRALGDAGVWDEVKDKLDQSALGLSGGQQQRLCIARSLAIGPDVLLMDEPTSALDPISTAMVEELARDLAGRCTVVIVTHNMQQATRIADATAFFLLGELVEAGPTAELFARPKDQRTEDYLTGRFG